MSENKPERVYVRRSKGGGPEGFDEWVVRVELRGGDMPICGCPGRWEADFVRQCILEALGSAKPCVRLRRMLKELRETF